MNQINKIVIKFNLKLSEGAKEKSTFVIKNNYLFYEDYTENPNESMFVADFCDTYTYKVNSDFFMEKTLRSELGLNDLREFSNEKATLEELVLENSYFMNDVLLALNKKDKE